MGGGKARSPRFRRVEDRKFAVRQSTRKPCQKKLNESTGGGKRDSHEDTQGLGGGELQNGPGVTTGVF